MNRLSMAVIAILPLFILSFSIIYRGEGWLLFYYSLITIFSLALAIYRNSLTDIVFFVVINSIIVVQLVSLQVWPEFLVFQEGRFSYISPVTSTIDRSFWLVICFVSGWIIVQFLDSMKTKLVPRKLEISHDKLNFLVYWFVMSVIITVLSALIYNHGIAGIKSEFPYEGILYYVFPVDYLAITLSFGLGLNYIEFKEKKIKICIIILFYIIIKMACGWKSPLLYMFLAYLTGLFYGNRLQYSYKFLFYGIITIISYLCVVKPIVSYARTGEFAPEKNAIMSSYSNPLSSRLTEGTLYGVSIIESGGNEGRVEISHFLGDFINRLVPGSVYDMEPIDKFFTEEVLGQPSGIQSTFAPGVVGVAELLGGGAPSLFYGVFVRTMVVVLIFWARRTNQLLTKLFLYGSIQIFIVSMCIDGLTGGAEKILLTGIIITIIYKLREVIVNLKKHNTKNILCKHEQIKELC